jgi:hypothetical protein
MYIIKLLAVLDFVGVGKLGTISTQGSSELIRAHAKFSPF